MEPGSIRLPLLQKRGRFLSAPGVPLRFTPGSDLVDPSGLGSCFLYSFSRANHCLDSDHFAASAAQDLEVSRMRQQLGQQLRQLRQKAAGVRNSGVYSFQASGDLELAIGHWPK
jgi:hypothetical protein